MTLGQMASLFTTCILKVSCGAVRKRLTISTRQNNWSCQSWCEDICLQVVRFGCLLGCIERGSHLVDDGHFVEGTTAALDGDVLQSFHDHRQAVLLLTRVEHTGTHIADLHASHSSVARPLHDWFFTHCQVVNNFLMVVKWSICGCIWYM